VLELERRAEVAEPEDTRDRATAGQRPLVGVDAEPALARPSVSLFGLRPVATSRASALRVLLTPRWSHTSTSTLVQLARTHTVFVSVNTRQYVLARSVNPVAMS
jgi:hypothetical protein